MSAEDGVDLEDWRRMAADERLKLVVAAGVKRDEEILIALFAPRKLDGAPNDADTEPSTPTSD